MMKKWKGKTCYWEKGYRNYIIRIRLHFSHICGIFLASESESDSELPNLLYNLPHRHRKFSMCSF